jgi:NCS2 family nucleobase:cation symporter-2/xanthine permease XanP
VFSNGTTVGGLTAIAMMLIITRRKGGGNRIVVPLDPRSLLPLRESVKSFSSRIGWDGPAENRLMLAIEEALLFLCEEQEGRAGGRTGRLIVKLAEIKGEVEVEMVTGPNERNAEEVLGELPEAAQVEEDANLSLRLLKKTVKDLKHLQYRQGDYLLMRIDSTG